MNTIADKIIEFNKSLDFNSALPDRIRILNPFKENENTISFSSAFYKKYYNDNNPRYVIFGINPGRFGAGLTGIPFTDPKRLQTNCNINYNGVLAHESSSAFMYEVIKAYGGEEEFYKKFYLTNICPLGFTSMSRDGKSVNCNYFDSKELIQSIFNFIVKSIQKQIAFGIKTDICFCIGVGDNEPFLQTINKEFGLFKNIIALEHPRYIMQFKSKTKQEYINRYINAFKKII